MIRSASFLLSLAIFAAPACVEPEEFPGADGSNADLGTPCTTAGEVQCTGSTLQRCEGGRLVDKEVCQEPKVCVASLDRCADCTPGKYTCQGSDQYLCGSNGKPGAKVKACTPYTCKNGYCTDPCSQAQVTRSYVGCDYWPTVTINSVVSDFSFAVVVANTSSQTAQVTIATVSNAKLVSASVPPLSIKSIILPWIDSLKLGGSKSDATVKEPSGAYRLTSTMPVTVYQFNALNYVLTGDCQKGYDPNVGDGKCYSYSNDASLLLPESSLGKEYMVVARPTIALYSQSTSELTTSPGFFSVVATASGSTKVTVSFSANTQAGAAGSGLKAYKAGSTDSFVLSRWSVLQIISELPSSCTPATTDSQAKYCNLSSTADLTGTIIKTDQDVAVFSGHACAFIPYNKWACDHLEEQITPLDSWGRHYLATHVASSKTDPSDHRIISAEDGNTITFKPSSIHAPVKLNKGKHIDILSTADFEVVGSGRFALAQFMVGQNYSNPNPGEGAPGDPAMALTVPVEQFRTSYRFFAPGTYQQNYVNVVAQASASVTLDDKDIAASSFATIPSTSYKVARLTIAGGAHSIKSTTAFGILVYGVGAYTSYMYPGGLDLNHIY